MEDKKDEKDQNKDESIKKEKKEILKYKEFQVDYLRIFRENYDNSGNINSNNPFDISDILKQCLNIPIVNRVKKYRGEIIRLQEIKKMSSAIDRLSSCDNLWVLHFVRIKTNLPAIATSEGNFSETLLSEKLMDNQYTAESTACLYDGNNQLMIIARHRDGVLPSGILEFFRGITKNKELDFAVIPNNVNIKAKTSNIYRRLIIGIKDVNNMNEKNYNFLKAKIPSVYNAIKGFEGYGYCNFKIELTMGNSPKNISMNNKKVKDDSLQLMESGIENISKLELAGKESEESSIETVDLLNNKVKDSFKIGYNRKEPILFNIVLEKLLSSYNRKKELLDKKIKNRQGDNYE